MLVELANRDKINDSVVEFVANIGRMKYIEPLYVGLYKRDKDRAKKTLEDNKSFYSSVVYGKILDDFASIDKVKKEEL